MFVKPGDRLRGSADQTEIVVVRAPNTDVDLRCGGLPVVALDVERASGAAAPAPAHTAGTTIGKRYTDTTSGLEVLCTKAGAGSLSLGDVPLALKDAKPLPGSD
jgi:hypothetical protein